MAIFQRQNLNQSLYKPKKVIPPAANLAEDQLAKVAQLRQKEMGGIPPAPETANQMTSSYNPNQGQSDADRVNAIRQGRGQTPPVTQTPPKPRVGSTPFNATTNQAPQADFVPGFGTGQSAGQDSRGALIGRNDYDKSIRDILDTQEAIKAGRDKARKALDEQLGINAQRATAGVRARSGALGAGNLGAAAQLESDVATQQGRDRTTQLDAFDQQTIQQRIDAARAATGALSDRERLGIERERAQDDSARLELDRQRQALDEEIKRGQRADEKKALEIALLELEDELGQDLNNDGKIANKPISADTSAQAQEGEYRTKEQRAADEQDVEKRKLTDSETRRVAVFAERYSGEGIKNLPPWYQEAARAAGSIETFIRREAKKDGKSVDQWISDFQSNPINMTGLINFSKGWGNF